ncbi:MAG: SDR family NAD(P)-dependent oxidoreductase [Exilibacterium sp.]
MMVGFKDKKTALVTGGNSGIGFATAKLLCQRGYHVFILGRQKETTIKAAESISCKYILADLENENEIIQLAEYFTKTGLDFLVNNAGVAQITPIDTITQENIQQHFSINVYAPLLLIRTLLSALKHRRGSVTNISSVITTRSSIGFTAYAASKGAIEAATKSLAVELSTYNVRVNAVCPGAIDTSIFSKMGIPDDQLPDLQARLLSTIPMGRIGKTNEVAEVILAQGENPYVTGSIWLVDGGVAA